MTRVPSIRIRAANGAPVNRDGRLVLYWMTAHRRLTDNYALQRAVEWANELGKPLLLLEPLRVGYPWANERFHAFVLQGMADHAAALAEGRVGYLPYVEPQPGAGKGLLEALARSAAVVVTDDYPAFFHPRMLEAAAGRLPVSLEAVDANGLLPLGAAPQEFGTAYQFRRFLHRALAEHLVDWPLADPLSALEAPRFPGVDRAVTDRWPAASADLLAAEPAALAALPIDHGVPPAPLRGGSRAAREAAERFLVERLPHYAERRNELGEPGTSGLSPYLHFGHLGAHTLFAGVAEAERWTPDELRPEARGGRAGWGMGESATAFVDQLVTWRELGYNMCAFRSDYDRYDSLPEWARRTLAEHARDPREYRYDLMEFEAAATHDELWNAAQRQLAREGHVHNYLRMLWGKKILEWSASPVEALNTMVELNNKYALDGRDPNSYSGIFWVLGRYDRAWGPERPVFGKVRYMSSQNTARKLRVQPYLERYGAEALPR
ncbi:MAG: deoxyribodipyrimidine photolyase [Gemmatimonadota bacterium]|nr:MAG: deoxyribodipyrimidine photolyase [Gemmatimonadota bacterium]